MDVYFINCKSDIKKIVKALTDIQTAITTFEENTPSLKDALETLGTLPEGFSVESITINLDGEEVAIETLVYTDENGNQYTVSEMVNAFYTYVGITVAADLALAFANPDISAADMDALLSASGKNTRNMVNSYLGKGFMSVASLNSISSMYLAATGSEFDKDKVHNKYMESFADFDLEELNKAFEGLTNASAIGAMALSGLFSSAYDDAVKPYTAPYGEINKDKLELDDDDKKDDKDDKDEKAEKAEKGEKGDSTDGLQDQTGNPGGGDDGSSGAPGDQNQGTDTEPGPDEPTTPTDDDTDTGLTPSDIVEPVDEEIAPLPEEKPLTNEVVDEMAQGSFYDKYTPEQLADYRNDQVEEFNNLNDEQLVEFLEDSGYSLPEAESIADNKELGLAAFLAAKQSADIANMAKDIAQNSNMNMAQFDTKFDDGASYQDLISGETNAFLSNPNYDEKVAAAKSTMSTAKTQYDKAVETANKSIEEANNNKEKLDAVKKKIVEKSGKDKNKWTDSDIKEYNKAVKEYNSSVEKANTDVKSAETAKTDYETSKDAYDKSKQEFYDKVKEEVVNNRDDGLNDIPSEETPNGDNANVPGYGGTQTPSQDEQVNVSDNGIGFGGDSADGSSNGLGNTNTGDTEGIGTNNYGTSSDSSDSEYIYNDNTNDNSNPVVSENGIGF